MLFVDDRDAPPVAKQSRMEVHSWRLIRTPAGTYHLVTLIEQCETRATVRVTSAITAVDSEAGLVTTSSGRQYLLMGPAEERTFERDILAGGAVSLGLGDAVDVTVFAWDQIQID
ncbi:hypothetical protein LXT12_26025 [Pelomonas sp. P7]|uniref:Quercetin 2,3-dioxygenase C-terminal cupin domain-containing protein n=1 Tax=Pelomonas caseinilytica TaxID=2906763 RepID=A0ABS8XQ39_9BURK|nr:hypothetical protein [Pelomonas sp. P7]MCE4540696.1 hypothetical protein [Pelomonas sp. P7]